MPKRKKPQEVPSSDSEEEEEQAASGDSSSSSSDEGSDSFPSGAEDSSGESSDDEGGEAFDQVDVDFGFYCPQEKDFLGLKTLLQNYLDGEQWACSDFADAIIQQGATAAVGSVIKCGEEDDPIGVCTVLNLARHGGSQPLRELKAFLLKAAGDSHRQRLEKAWSAPATALLVDERLVNSPPELAEPLQESLFGEVQEAAADEELSQEERSQFQLKQFLMVVRAYQDPSQQPQQQPQGAGAGGSKPGGKKKKKQQGRGGGDGGSAAAGVVHFLPEAECYHAAAEWSFAFPSADRLVGKDELQPCRVVMLVSAAAAAAAREQLAALMRSAAQ